MKKLLFLFGSLITSLVSYCQLTINQTYSPTANLKVGDTVRQLPGQPHQLEALTDGTVFEVSTQHFDQDSYRVWKGDTQMTNN